MDSDRRAPKRPNRSLATIRRLEALLAAIPDIIMEVDADKIYTWANQPGLEFFGDDVVGREAAFYFEGEQDTYDQVRPLFEGDEHTFCVESWQRRRDGERRLLAWWSRVLKDGAGNVTGVLSTARDITVLRQAEEARRTSEAQLSNALQMTRAGHWEYDVDRDEFTFNDNFYRIFRTTAAEVGGYQMSSADYSMRFCHPNDAALVADEIRKAIESTDPNYSRQLEHRILYADGEVGTITVRFITIKDPQGRTVKTCGVNQDITARKQMEDELRASEDRFRSIFAGVSDGIVLTDLTTGKFAFSNVAFRNMLGYSEEEIVDLDFAAIHPRESLDRLQEPFRPVLGNAPGTTPDMPVLRKDGSVVWADIKGMVVEIGGKKYALGCFRDVTEKRELHARLSQSERLSIMGTLAAGVAHEINNPLSYVLYNIESLSEDMPRLVETMRRCHAELGSHLGPQALAELLGTERDSFSPAMLDDLVERFRDALSGMIRIKDIARGLGTFSRVERTELAPIDLAHVIEQATNMAHNEIRFRARLVKDFGQVPPVLASDGKLAQVFLNLLINAAHSIGEGHVERNEIRVRTWAEGDQVLAEVSDTGSGIAPEHRGKIFEPFFSTKGIGVGAGLGLAICKSIITGFGGEISFTSEVGQGTRFVIRLPRVPRDWEARRTGAQEQVPVRPKLRGRILVVDDEAGIRAIIGRMLGREHEVVAVSSGEEAQVLLEKDRRFDLIFSDLMMPRVSGMELHAWLQQRDPALAEQVVFISGGAFTSGAAEYLSKVGNLRVEKPFDTVTFRKMVEELVLAARAKHKP